MLMSLSEKRHLFAIYRIFIPLLFCTSASSSSCPRTCGHIKRVKHPFTLNSDNTSSCGPKGAHFQVDCHNNQALLNLTIGKQFHLQEINYKHATMRLVDPGIHRENLSSCPLYSLSTSDTMLVDLNTYWLSIYNVPVTFIHCLSPVSSVKYVNASFCGNRSSIFANTSEFLYGYVIVGNMMMLELESSCTVDKVSWAQLQAMGDNLSLENIYDGLAYGFYVRWSYPYTLMAYLYNAMYILLSPTSGMFAGLLVGLRFVIGFPFLICLVVYKWRKRHLSMDKTIEEFLQREHNLKPIHYTYSNIKKMTNNFKQKLGEGGCGVVYKGKLRSGSYAAIKMMEQSVATEEEFINEVATIGQIHHCNVVQLIGFCVRRSKYALVYEFLPNGSLDRYLFSKECLDHVALTYEKMFEIAIGVACGINYLHHGCNMQILHFDIKPHNILLDENFNPKISDFGLARLHPTNESCINLTSARGTVGYMAPEMFYQNIGRVSYKADVYSYGMMLMEIARTYINPFVEDISEIHFPSWVYDHLCAGYDIEVKDATEEERKMVKKIVLVALWCIQMRPSDRPAMNKVVDMLEAEVEPQMPPKPFVAPREMAAVDHGITETYCVDCVDV